MPRAIARSLLLVSCLLFGCDGAASDTGSVSGTISMPAALQARLGASDALFIVARKPGVKGGPPLAVKKIIGMRFPLTYSFGPEDVMLKGTAFSGPVEVVARIRQSGNAMLPMPGDMEGTYAKNPVAVGAHGVDFAIDRVLQ